MGRKFFLSWAGGRRELNDGQVLKIGRRATCDVCVPDNRTVSSNHCTVLLSGGSLVVEDSSTHGTKAGGSVLRKGGRTSLSAPADFAAGDERFRFEVEEEAAQPPSPKPSPLAKPTQRPSLDSLFQSQSPPKPSPSPKALPPPPLSAVRAAAGAPGPAWASPAPIRPAHQDTVPDSLLFDSPPKKAARTEIGPSKQSEPMDTAEGETEFKRVVVRKGLEVFSDNLFRKDLGQATVSHRPSAVPGNVKTFVKAPQGSFFRE